MLVCGLFTTPPTALSLCTFLANAAHTTTSRDPNTAKFGARSSLLHFDFACTSSPTSSFTISPPRGLCRLLPAQTTSSIAHDALHDPGFRAPDSADQYAQDDMRRLQRCRKRKCQVLDVPRGRDKLHSPARRRDAIRTSHFGAATRSAGPHPRILSRGVRKIQAEAGGWRQLLCVSACGRHVWTGRSNVQYTQLFGPGHYVR
ncbi:hypothetical protein P280DRAFT_60044 [Massarina eburnea CBS 473.64]|uniref:Uncharacterized protein n=1 Tax=Massarina eburnea CBS 473.64 TaxID=1395130 RepID=A0A6A6RUW3_9PLEO|nr:hypothetical protein P280DRAFT_60044 [Massarina eburnea CBS 473.64]